MREGKYSDPKLRFLFFLFVFLSPSFFKVDLIQSQLMELNTEISQTQVQDQPVAEPVRYVGFWVRAVADVLDSMILSAASWFIEMVFLGAIHWGQVLFLSAEMRATMPGFSDAFSPLTLQVVNFLLYGLIAFPYTVFTHYYWGATLAKRIFGIQVCDYPSLNPITLRQSVIRCSALIVSYLPLGAGYLMVGLHPQKRALHDLIAGTVSIYRKGQHR